MNPVSNTSAAVEEKLRGNGGSPQNSNTAVKPVAPSVLTGEMLERFAARAAGYDRDNRFFEEDFEELRVSGYLTLPVPTEFGGAGMTLAEVCREQRRWLTMHPPLRWR